MRQGKILLSVVFVDNAAKTIEDVMTDIIGRLDTEDWDDGGEFAGILVAAADAS